MMQFSAVVLLSLAARLSESFDSPKLAMSFGPPIPLVINGTKRGGKTSNVLDLYPDGFATDVGIGVSSVDGGKTYQNASFLLTRAQMWTSFAIFRNGTGHPWAHDFGTVNEALYPSNWNSTSVSSNSSFTYRFSDGILGRTPGPGVTFSGLPRVWCPKSASMTVYASGHVTLPDGTHLQTAMTRWCDAPGAAPIPFCPVILAFTSKDGYNYEYASNVSTCLDPIGRSSEGPNEHDIALLPNGDVICVFRTGAGDGKGSYLPFYMTKSTDGGKTWSKAVPLVDTDRNYIGCARPHLVQVGNATLLSGGRMMMGHDYSRAFSVWMSQDGGETWKRADGSYEHNAKAHMTNTPMWPYLVNRTGWRFGYSGGYVGLVRAGEMSAVVMYDFCDTCKGNLVELTNQSSTRLADDFLDSEFSQHGMFYSYSMRIDLVQATKQDPANSALVV